MESVDVLVQRDALQHLAKDDARRQRQLDQDAVRGLVGVEGVDALEQCGLGDVRR
jgi:hypothetical protein